MKNLIRKILKEELDWFEQENFEVSPAEKFIYNKFMECKLEPIKNKNWLGWTRYVDKSGKILFVDNIETGKEDTILYFDYEEIYQKLLKMGLNYEEIQVLVKDMLYETHKRKVLTTTEGGTRGPITLYETHKRKVNIYENTTNESFDFNKPVYVSETKSIVVPYMVIDEDDKTITVLNIKEIIGDIFLDNAYAYDITIHRVKLPKSQVEILSDVKDKDGFKFIKIPYWLFKNNLTDLDIKRIKGGWDGSGYKKRLSIPVRKLMDPNFISNFKDENVVNYISVTNPEKKTNELIRSYAEKGFKPL